MTTGLGQGQESDDSDPARSLDPIDPRDRARRVSDQRPKRALTRPRAGWAGPDRGGQFCRPCKVLLSHLRLSWARLSLVSQVQEYDGHAKILSKSSSCQDNLQSVRVDVKPRLLGPLEPFQTMNIKWACPFTRPKLCSQLKSFDVDWGNAVEVRAIRSTRKLCQGDVNTILVLRSERKKFEKLRTKKTKQRPTKIGQIF